MLGLKVISTLLIPIELMC